MPTALPPLETLTSPLSIVLMIVPPDSTFRVPPELTMTPELVWPADDVQRLARQDGRHVGDSLPLGPALPCLLFVAPAGRRCAA